MLALQSTSITVPDTNDLFGGEEDVDGGPSLNNGSATSTPRASLLTHHNSEANNKTTSQLQQQQSQSTSLRSPSLTTSLRPSQPPPSRPANTYENTPVSPTHLPAEASVSLITTTASTLTDQSVCPNATFQLKASPVLVRSDWSALHLYMCG